MRCIGKNRDGGSCKNWAIKGSYYCSSHQGQVTEQDVQNMKTAQSWSTALIILIIVVGFIIFGIFHYILTRTKIGLIPRLSGRRAQHVRCDDENGTTGASK